MPTGKGYSITPQPEAGQPGPAWIRWLDRYAAAHAAAVAQVAVRDFPPLVREQITQEEDGETATPSTMQLGVTLLARLGAAHALRRVPRSPWTPSPPCRRRWCWRTPWRPSTRMPSSAPSRWTTPRRGGRACWARPSSSGSLPCWRPPAPRRRSGAAEA